MSGKLQGVFDPRKLGCACDYCGLGHYLRGIGAWKPVPTRPAPKVNHHKILLLGEAPGDEEVKHREPFYGRSGSELITNLYRQSQLTRDDVALGNAMLCQPPEMDGQKNNLDKFDQWLARENAQRAERNEIGLMHPIQACRPQLLRQLQETPNVLAVGATPYRAISGKKVPIRKMRGAMMDMLLEERQIESGTERLIHRSVPTEDPERAIFYGQRTGQLTPLQVLPTVHPAFVLRDEAWRPLLLQDIGRFYRWVTKQIQWQPFRTQLHPTVQQIHEFLFSGQPFYAVDIETGGDGAAVRKEMLDPRTNKVRSRWGWDEKFDARDIFRCYLRCIAIGTPDSAIVIPWRSINGQFTFDGVDACDRVWNETQHVYENVVPNAYYNRDAARDIKEMLRVFFTSPSITKVGHNFIAFDTPVLMRVLGMDVPITPLVNTTLGMRSAHSEIPRDLYTAGTLYTDVPAWKAAADERKIAQNPRSDKELHIYAAHDVVVNARILPPMWNDIVQRQQVRPLALDHEVDQICREMTWMGVRVDQDRRAKMEAEHVAETEDLLVKMRAMLGKDAVRVSRFGKTDFSPTKNSHLSKIFFEDWGIPLEHHERTETGIPKLDDAVFRRWLGSDEYMTPEQKQFIGHLRMFKEKNKLLNTYLRPFAVGRMCRADGRIHPRFACHTPKTGRISGAGPNPQNIPAELLVLFIPNLGNVFIGADYKQIELRIFAGLAGIREFLNALNEKEETVKMPNGHWKIAGDPHTVTSLALYESQFQREIDRYGETGKKSELFESLRRLAKAFIYAVFYGAQAPTIYKTVSSAEDPKTKRLLFPEFTEIMIERIYRRLMKNMPEIKAYWEQTWNFAKTHLHVAECILGRRRDFPTFNPNEILNHPIQCIPADVRVLTDLGYLPIGELVGRRFKAWTGKKWAPATAICKGDAEIWQVRTKRGTRLSVDATHKFLAATKTEYEWRETADLRLGGRVAIDMARALEFGEAVVPAEDAWVLGYWTGDGSSSDRAETYQSGVITFIIGREPQTGPLDQRAAAIIDARIHAWAAERNLQVNAVHQTEGHGSYALPIEVGGFEWLRSFGADPAWKADTKRIPESIWRAPLAARREFLRGLLCADGCAHPDGTVVLNLCQRQLLEEVWLLARTVGVEALGIYGPYASDRKGHTSYRLTLNAETSATELGWGQGVRSKHAVDGASPPFECARVLASITPKWGEMKSSATDHTIRCRLRKGGSTSPYVLRRMGADDLYDHATIATATPRRVRLPVFTLCVDDPEHRYVAEGFISKNSAAASIMSLGLINARKNLKPDYTRRVGINMQVHDFAMLEVPEREAEMWKTMLTESMTQRFDEIPGVLFGADAKVGPNWYKVK